MKIRIPKILLLGLFILYPICSVFAASKSDIEKRAKQILYQMTLEEKVDYIGGYKEFNIRPIERLGIPRIIFADGPVGCRNYGKTTAYPASIGLAATWNREIANQFGVAIGRDCRARGVHVLLMPGVNMYRSPLCGRNFEYLGEDPCLSGETAVAVIKGVQSQGVMATVKHYAVNNQEYDRHGVSSDLDMRTLHEIYLPAFKNVILNSGVGSLMTAYNLVNGIHCSQHDYLINTLLKEQWGFDGIVMSDWNSTYDGVAAALGGLDLEMPSGKFMNRENLLPAIESGQISVKVLDDKVLRILRTIIRMGFLDRPQKDESIPLNDPISSQAALEVAREGIVLLRNNNVLPLNPDKIKTIAIVGPNASMTSNCYGGGGSSFTTPFHVVSLIEAVKEISQNQFAVKIINNGNKTDVPQKYVFSDIEFTNDGLKAKIYANDSLYREKEPPNNISTIAQRTDPIINFSAAENNFDIIGQPFCALWQGEFTVKKTGIYRVSANVKGRLRYVSINDELVLRCSDGEKYSDTVLEEGKQYKIKFYYVVYSKYKDNWKLHLGLNFLDDFGKPENLDIMRQADVVLVCAGFNPELEFEGGDRPYHLPRLQEILIEQATSVNRNTVVIVNAGGGFATQGWIDNVDAMIHSWYPGQNGNIALAEILFGQTNPSGKLPITFEKRLEDVPAYKYYHDEDCDKHVAYAEGIFTGYRGYDKTNIEPLFCFGHGLSYTTFEYRDLKIEPAVIIPGQNVTVSISIKNTGLYAGRGIIQLYVRDVESSLPRPFKELRDFASVELEPGQSRLISFILDAEKLALFNPDKMQWQTEPGKFEIMLGSSSRDIRLKGIVSFEKQRAFQNVGK